MVRGLIDLYIFVLIIDVVLSYFPGIRNASYVVLIRRISDLTCAPIRRFLPRDLPFDFSPFIVILGLKFIVSLW